MGGPELKPLRFTGTIGVQFQTFLQGLMQTDEQGSQAFVGVVQGFFGNPPNGTRFEARVKLSVGAFFSEDAYEVMVHPALSQLGARPELRTAALDFVNRCMTMMVGPNWRQMTGLTATNNVIQTPGPLVTIEFGPDSAGW